MRAESTAGPPAPSTGSVVKGVSQQKKTVGKRGGRKIKNENLNDRVQGTQADQKR